MTSAEADPIGWAYEYVGVDAGQTFDEVSRAIHQHQRVNDTHLGLYARDIVLTISRFRQFRDDPEYNAKFLHTDEQTPFQNLLLFLLRRFHELGYRRRGDSCYEMVRGMDGEPSFAWSRVCTIREFLLREVRKETVPDQWRNLTNPRDNLDVVSRHLTEVEHPEFSSLRIDPRFVAFHNGLYSIDDNVFWPRDRVHDWEGLGRQVEMERREQHWGEEYALVTPTEHTCACHFVDAVFRDHSDGAAMTDIFELFSKVGVDKSMHWWLCVMLGRLLFPLKQHDQWQVMPYFKTVEAADHVALSAFVDAFQRILGASAVTHIVSGTSSHVALESLTTSRVGFMLLRDSMPLEQGDWQSWTCGEPVCIAPGKAQTPYSHQPACNLIAIGSHVGYKNDAGTVDRRVVMFDMTAGTSEAFHALRHAIQQNLDLWVQTIVDAYLTATHQFGARDVWAPNVLPASMHALRQSLREITTPLLSCILSDTFRRDPAFFMPLSDFKEIYQDYRRRRGLPTQRWVREHWQATFQDMRLTIERGPRDYHGARNTEWVVGIDLIERSATMALTITSDTLGQLQREQTRLDSELQRVSSRLELAKMIYEADAQVQEWKAKRHELAERYRVLEIAEQGIEG